MKQLLVACVASVTLAMPSYAREAPRPPDVVVYLADDLSAADLPLYGGTNILTPAISRLAAEGLTFNRAFVASPSCAPSRAALLTGRMPARNGAEENHSYPREDILRLPRVLLVPESERDRIAAWLAGRGMRCSVYAAQYLMEGLFENGAAAEALALMTADNDRSWRHMVESGTTISWEAWDQKYKPNQDWNHAWDAAPANLLPRYVLGAEPLGPGWKPAHISPRPGTLSFARGKVPTRNGPILINWTHGETFRLSLQLPEGMAAKVDLPKREGSTTVLLNGTPVRATDQEGRWVVGRMLTGSVVLEVKE